MTYLLRKFLNKFIVLETSNNQIFYGEVLALTRNILTLKGVKINHQQTEILNTYYIDTNHLIWFKEAYDYDNYSLFSKNDVKSLKTPKEEKKEEPIETDNLSEDIEKTVNILGNLFENLIEIENEEE